MDIYKKVAEIEPEIYEMFHYIHEHPELSMKEYNTSSLIQQELRKKTQVDSVKKVGDTGWVVEIKGRKPGPDRCIALRGDMDALPIHESENNSPRSQVDGVMHACGHDVHTSILMGAVRVLEQYRDEISGSILFFFQPGEEVLRGAKLFLESPEIDFDRIDGVAACHVSPELDAGTIGVRRGPILASADALRILVKGKGGHGAHPSTVIDPVLISAQIITALQALVSREISSNESAVLSICTIHGGQVNNIVPDEVAMTGTLRTLDPEIRRYLIRRVSEICDGIAGSMRAKVEAEVELGPPPFISDDEWVDRVVRSGSKLLGAKHVIEMKTPSMGAEDFAYIKEKKPGVFVRLGARTPGGAYGSMHSSTFYCDRKSLTTGILTLAGIALDFFNIKY